MDPTLSDGQRELQARARNLVRDVLQPLEVEFERAGGRLPTETRDHIRQGSIAAGLVGGSLALRSSTWTIWSPDPSRPAGVGQGSGTKVLHPARHTSYG